MPNMQSVQIDYVPFCLVGGAAKPGGRFLCVFVDSCAHWGEGSGLNVGEVAGCKLDRTVERFAFQLGRVGAGAAAVQGVRQAPHSAASSTMSRRRVGVLRQAFCRCSGKKGVEA